MSSETSPTLPTTAKGRATRRRLLESAERLFGQKGYHNTSVVDITQAAEVGHGTFYLYFKGKEEIFRELVRHLNHELRKTIAAAVEGIDDRLEMERKGFQTFFDFARDHRNLYRIIHEAEAVDPELPRWHYETLAKGYTRGLEEAMGAGKIRELDPEAVAYFLQGIAVMMGMRWILWEEREPPEEWMETLRVFLRSALAPGSDQEGDPR